MPADSPPEPAHSLSRRVPPAEDHAIVIGSGMMGMCVAETLAGHYAHVTIIDRDELPLEGAPPRRGVPQSLHPHGLQVRGRVELDNHFPGLLDELRAQGAVEFDASRVARFGAHGWAPRYNHLDLTLMGVSRTLVETTIRRLLRKHRPDIRWVEGARVTGLIHEGSSPVRVTGVQTDHADPALQTLRASLVVDCAGRGSRALKWLEQMGLPRPEELRVDSHSNYASRRYRMPDGAEQWWWRHMIVDSLPPDVRRACVISPIEDRTWLVTAIGINRDYAPTDEAAWLEFIAGLRSPMASQILQNCEPLTDIVQSRTMQSIWRRMDRYDGKVDGYLIAGDALCTFNPSYGQGITGAVLASTCLGDVLKQRGTAGMDHRGARAFYRSAARWQNEGWDYSVSMDMRWPDTDGKRPAFHETQRWMTGWLEKVAIHDEEMVKVITKLFDFGANRWSILSPWFIGRFYYGLARNLLRRPQLLGPTEMDPFEPRPRQV